MSEFTGERVVPGEVNDDLWAEHISRYAFASRFAPGARALDLGCGTGYGAALLAEQAVNVMGIDVAPEAIRYARSHYPIARLHLAQASASCIPFANASFDLITAFEVIEHLADWRSLLSEARRVLRPNGVFLVSTPNKAYYTESRGAEGPNPFHEHEFEADEFQAALTEFFPRAAILLQNRVHAFAFYPHGQEVPFDARIGGWRGTPEDAHFLLGVCSIDATPDLRGLIYVPQASNVLREREHHIESLRRELKAAREERDAVMREHAELTADLEKKIAWIHELDRQIADAGRNVDRLENTVIERSLWARSLDARLQWIEATRWHRLGRKLNQIPPQPENAPAPATAEPAASGNPPSDKDA